MSQSAGSTELVGSDSDFTLSDSEELSGRRVLLTGGAGFIGSHTAEALLARGDRVVIVDELNDYYDVTIKRANLRRLEERYGAQLHVVQADVCDRALMETLFVRERFTAVCHLAARAGVRPSLEDPFIYLHSNVEGTTTLLELARTHGSPHFVYASSSSVYGDCKAELFSEADQSTVKPVSPYAATKMSCELLAHTYHHLYQLSTTGLRFFTVYGPGGRPDMAPFKFVHRIYNGIQIDRYGDGSSERDYTYIDDIVDGIVLALDKPLGCQVFNLGNGNPVSLRDFIATIERKLGIQANIRQLPAQPGDVPRTAADICRAGSMLGYRPKVALEQGLDRLCQWYKDEYVPMLGQSDREEAPEDSQSSTFIATRVHCPAGALPPQDLSSLKEFLLAATGTGCPVGVATDSVCHARVLELVESLELEVKVLLVTPWGKFTAALNALVAAALEERADSILFQSVELRPSVKQLESLRAQLDSDTLVVGAALTGHTFSPGQQLLDGCTVPWNTAALWSLPKLARTGFPMLAEGLLPGVSAGVEEAATVAMQQRLEPGLRAKVRLLGQELAELVGQLVRVALGKLSFEPIFGDKARQEWHEFKMKSKVMSLQGVVHHLSL